MASTLPQVEILMPTKKPPGADLPLAQQRANQALHSRRLRIEHVNSSVKGSMSKLGRCSGRNGESRNLVVVGSHGRIPSGEQVAQCAV